MKTSSLTCNGAMLLETLEIADREWDRFKGLLGRRGLPPRQGLLIPRCPAIHMIGMRFAIDCIFIGRDHRVVALKRNVRPGTFCCRGGPGAVAVIEIATGWLREEDVRIGDQLAWDIGARR